MKKQKQSKKGGEESGLRGEIRRLGVMIEGVNDGVKIVAEQYGDIKYAINEMGDDIGIIKDDIELIKGSLRKKVDYDEFLFLEKRVALLESKGKR